MQLIGYALLVPFFGWGIYLLRRRYLYYEENTIGLEIATSVFVALFFWIEALILRQSLSGQLVLFFAGVLGLTIAGFALYAHVAISLASRLVVELVSPGDDSAQDHPRFGPVESLERNGDYEAALNEYLVLARIYPRNVEVLRRTANVHLALDQVEEAVEWFLRARKRAIRADDALEIANQLCRIYDNELDQPEKADHYLASFIRDFPDSPDVDIVRDRLNRRSDKTDWSVSDFLEALEDDPLGGRDSTASPDDVQVIAAPVKKASQPVELVALDVAGAADSVAMVPAPERAKKPLAKKPVPKKRQQSTLTPLSDSQFDVLKVGEKSPAKDVSNGNSPKANSGSASKRSSLEALESLDKVEKPPELKKPATPSNKSSSLSLDPMEDKPS